MLQYHDKGGAYLKGFLPKRLISVWVPLLIAALLLSIEKLVLHEHVGFDNLVLSAFRGEYFVPYSGFVVALSFFYILFYLAAKLREKYGGVFWTVLVIGYLLWVIQCFVRGLSDGSYRTCSVFIFGAIWAANKARIERKLVKSDKKYPLYLLTSIAVFCILFVGRGLIPQEGKIQLLSTTEMQANEITTVLRFVVADFSAMAFCTVLVILGLKVQFHNRVLQLLGKASYEIYLLQGLWMLLARNDRWSVGSDFLYTMVVLFGTVLTAILMQKLDGYIIGKTKLRPTRAKEKT